MYSAVNDPVSSNPLYFPQGEGYNEQKYFVLWEIVEIVEIMQRSIRSLIVGLIII